jgi:hypothetical protein
MGTSTGKRKEPGLVLPEAYVWCFFRSAHLFYLQAAYAAIEHAYNNRPEFLCQLRSVLEHLSGSF